MYMYHPYAGGMHGAGVQSEGQGEDGRSRVLEIQADRTRLL